MDKNSKEYKEALLEFYQQLDSFFENLETFKEIDEDIYEPIRKFTINSDELFNNQN